MEKIDEEKQALLEIRKIEEEIQERLDLAKRKARDIIAEAMNKANALIREKEARLAEVRQSACRNEAFFPEGGNGVELPLPASSQAAVREIAKEFFELLIK
ncbi:MAG: hypothetical protein HZA01_12410 [Nitrospinae bacterium]|nr:hypothetical protein [Nitrospinota bacterium]